MHPLFSKSSSLTEKIIGAAIENIPIGLFINFHEIKFVNGIHRLILPGASKA
ncbi:MAG TPA: hypothetical protein VFM25_01980 [Verrucomicrobiae bacterium]|jgi:hypothetical protein|nr:hypothetical protein [Verrucomicrobiae bacterium]